MQARQSVAGTATGGGGDAAAAAAVEGDEFYRF